VKVLLVSDLHYRLRQLDWLLHRAAAVDAVMIAGDLLDVRSQVALDLGPRRAARRLTPGLGRAQHVG
jgi:Icc-related predicted phosphoesterase